jgi:3-methylfumaryl-CoA hydratase
LHVSELTRWVGQRERRTDWITPARVAAWDATLDRPLELPDDGQPVRPGFHWALFPSLARTSELGDDGHARTGEFLPPVTLPRRMWAGSRLTFHRSLRVGTRVERESSVHAVEEKQSRHGPLVFVTIRHEVLDGDGVAVEEEQDIVYRGVAMDDRTTQRSPDAERPAAWRRRIHPSETLLFRYSALTFNGHRIHYDRRYAESAGYPGLVVHGPLIATLLLDLVDVHAQGAVVERFRFRATRPTFDVSPFAISGAPDGDGRHVRLWSTDNAGHTAVEADAWIR